jgi:hypothetical protein
LSAVVRTSGRRILYMATVAAIKYNPVIRGFFHRLVAAGRPGKVAVIAAMRKLLTILNAMRGKPLDPKDSRSRPNLGFIRLKPPPASCSCLLFLRELESRRGLQSATTPFEGLTYEKVAQTTASVSVNP